MWVTERSLRIDVPEAGLGPMTLVADHTTTLRDSPSRAKPLLGKIIPKRIFLV